MKTYVIQYRDPNKKDIARRIILEEGGIITQGYSATVSTVWNIWLRKNKTRE